MKSVLMIDEYIPMPDRDAGSKTTDFFIKYFLRRGYNLFFLSDKHRAGDEKYIDYYNGVGIHLFFDAEDFLRHEDSIDVLFINRINILKKYHYFSGQFANAKFIYFGHDLRSLRKRRQFIIEKSISDLFKSFYWLLYEKKLHKIPDIIFYPSEIEVNILSKKNQNVYKLDLYACEQNRKVIEPTEFKSRKGLLFVGGFAHKPNLDGISWFLNDVFIKVKNEIPIYIVGSNAPVELYKFNNENNIFIKGFLSEQELEKLYSKIKMVVVPLRYGAGIKGKLLEALFRNIPIVATAYGAEGLRNIEKILMIENDEQRFADAINNAYSDDIYLSHLSSKICSYVSVNFSVTAYDEYLDQFMVPVQKN